MCLRKLNTKQKNFLVKKKNHRKRTLNNSTKLKNLKYKTTVNLFALNKQTENSFLQNLKQRLKLQKEFTELNMNN